LPLTRRFVRSWGIDMASTGKRKEPAVKDEKKTSNVPAPVLDDEDYEDGDFATPKRDRHGEDDEPI